MLHVFGAFNYKARQYGALIAISGVVISVTGVVVAAGALYGATAFEAFMGREAWLLLVGDDPTRWPTWTFWDFTMIPWSLLVSGFDRPFHMNCMAVLAALPVNSLSDHSGEISFPPNPMLAVGLFPFLIYARRIIYNSLSEWILKKAAEPLHQKTRHHRPRGGDSRQVALIPEIVLNFGQGEAEVFALDNERPALGDIQQQANQVAGPVGDRVINGSTLGGYLVKPLLLPFVAKWMGSLLLSLSNRWLPLKQVLGIRQNKIPLITYSQGARVGIGTSWTWDDLDPVW